MKYDAEMLKYKQTKEIIALETKKNKGKEKAHGSKKQGNDWGRSKIDIEQGELKPLIEIRLDEEPKEVSVFYKIL